jgi:Na+-translocating ferredoxin:NAD+ oxidoreductase subunit G
MEPQKKSDMQNATHLSGESNASSAKMLWAMVGIGTICALLIVLTYESTSDRIASLQDDALEAAVFKVLPGTTSTKAFTLQPDGKITLAKADDGQLIYAGYDARHQFTGVAVEASGQGYAGIIRVLYGYQPEQEKIIGFYVLQSNETPGLGDKIEKDNNFLANFKALDVALDQSGQLLHAIVPVKNGTKSNAWEIDAITGATISSRSVADILHSSIAEKALVITKNIDVFMQ